MWTKDHKFPYEWTLKDSLFTKDKWVVFSCFACGGWSTMWYKLAWFDVIWCNEIDKKMNACYVANHNPKYNYLEDIRTFKQRKDLPKELYNLDILDWSPPCSSFSMAGNREDDRWKEKKFREWQELQELDTLFFDFIDLAKELQPKIVVAENVKWLLLGEARKYVQEIYKQFDEAWYYLDHYLLNASTMWVPQARERVFFVAVRKDQKQMIKQKDMFNFWPKLKLEFNEDIITYVEIEDKSKLTEEWKHIPEWILPFREKIEPWRSCADVHPDWHYFQELKLHPNKPLPTLRAGSNSYYHYKLPRRLFDNEIIKWWSFPYDYNFLKQQPIYVIWMSVPPVMMAHIASEIYSQLLEADHETPIICTDN